MNTTHCGAGSAKAHDVASLTIELALISAQAEAVAQAIRDLGDAATAATDEIQAVICQLETAATVLRSLEEEQGDDGADDDNGSEALTAEERNPSLLRSGRF